MSVLNDEWNLTVNMLLAEKPEKGAEELCKGMSYAGVLAAVKAIQTDVPDSDEIPSNIKESLYGILTEASTELLGKASTALLQETAKRKAAQTDPRRN